jgi:hypothetical protein
MARGRRIRLYAALVVVLNGLGVGLLTGPSTSEAAEQRCNQLGASCVCARSLSASRWVQSSQANFYYEADQDTSDSKLCSVVTADGRATVWTPDGADSMSVVSGLRGVPALQHNGLTFVVEPSAAMKQGITGRVGMRYYLKLGPGYQSTGDGGCTNDKYIQWGDYLTAYNTGFTNSADGRRIGITPASIIGKWYRIEMYLDSNSNPSNYTVYFKNVTDNTPEVVMTFPARLGTDPAMRNGNSHPIHRYRAGSCSGGSAMMYALLAHWPSPGGQRIGPASELEGSGGGGGGPVVNSAPQVPTGLTVR